jgi:hypothetical protein
MPLIRRPPSIARCAATPPEERRSDPRHRRRDGAAQSPRRGDFVCGARGFNPGRWCSLDTTRLFSTLLALTLALAASPAHADPTDACIDASVKGQELRDQGKLIVAREKFLQCSQKPCPGLLRKDCAGWLADVEARTPSIIVTAQDPSGHDAADVAVAIDGQPFLARLDGKAAAIDPGSHLLRFERAGSPAIEDRVVVREGDHRRVVSVRFQMAPAPSPPPLPPASRAGRVAVTALLGGISLAGWATFAALGIGAKQDADELRATCAPACPAGEVDAIRSKEIAADVGLGLGLAAAVGAAALIVTWPPAASNSAAARLSVGPAAGGGIAAFTARF